jgi:hypothetical protein
MIYFKLYKRSSHWSEHPERPKVPKFSNARRSCTQDLLIPQATKQELQQMLHQKEKKNTKCRSP